MHPPAIVLVGVGGSRGAAPEEGRGKGPKGVGNGDAVLPHTGRLQRCSGTWATAGSGGPFAPKSLCGSG